MFYFHQYLGMIPILTNIFQMGWNHQLENDGNPTLKLYLLLKLVVFQPAMLVYHLYTTYIPRIYHVYTTYIPRTYHVYTTYIPLMYHLYTTYCIYHLYTTYIPLIYVANCVIMYITYHLLREQETAIDILVFLKLHEKIVASEFFRLLGLPPVAYLQGQGEPICAKRYKWESNLGMFWMVICFFQR